MATKINARSPYYLKFSDDNLATVDLDLYIWEGLSTDSTTAKYQFTKSKIGSNDYVAFEISEYIKDYLLTEYNSYSTDVVWVKWNYDVKNSSGTSIYSGTSSVQLGVASYGYFEDGSQSYVRIPATSYSNVISALVKQVLQSNTTLYYNDGDDILIPVWAEFGSTVQLTSSAAADVNWDAVEDFWDALDLEWGNAGSDGLIVDNGNSNQKIQYVRITDTELLNDGDYVTFTSGDLVETVVLKKVCEPKYTPLNVIFFNKFGALQNLWLFKKSTESINVTADKYKRNVMTFDGNPEYSTVKHQSKRLNVNANEYIIGNTGYLDEDHNEVIRELMLSQEVWIDNGVDILPVNPRTNSMTFKTSVNDKMINYTLEFDYAFDKINNVR